MLIRKANKSDSDDLLVWRNEYETRLMSFEQNLISEDAHRNWFSKSLKDKNRKILIGELEKAKIGVCRFDKDDNQNVWEVSINLNPNFKGKGLGKIFLKNAVDFFQKTENLVVCAKVKVKNVASLKTFLGAGFKEIKSDKSCTYFEKERKTLSFRPVEEKDKKFLYMLLKERRHNISHRNMPSFSEHEDFLRRKPYRFWYMVCSDTEIGSFYIQDDNSIGIHLLAFKKEHTQEVLGYIINNFEPKKGVPSKIPPYFYINVPQSDRDLREDLEAMGLQSIQTSYELPLRPVTEKKNL